LLRQYRLTAGLSQEELAERAGLSVQGLSALENGRRQVRYQHTIILLARAMGRYDAETAALEAAVVRARGSLLVRNARAATRPDHAAGDGHWLLYWTQKVAVAAQGWASAAFTMTVPDAACAGMVKRRSAYPSAPTWNWYR
jgi:transcriptional regulator with XRE-family HTH domain